LDDSLEFAQSPSSALLGALSDALGQAIALDGEEECVLEFEQGVEVLLAQATQAQVLSLRSALTPAGQPIEPAQLHKALALNYTSMPPGIAIALEEASAQLVLVALVDAQRTPADDFLSLLSEFVALVPQLRDGAGEPQAGAGLAPDGMGVMA
jgi:predicted PhzF superfamily epimerase YddE/YHI9